MVKKLLFISTLFLIFILSNIDVNAVSFSTNGYTCVNFLNGNQYCSNVRQFDYDNIPYFGSDFSYSPDNLDEVSITVLDFRNQSFCPNNSSGGFLNFRFYHNYAFTNSVLNFIQASVDGKNYLCSSSLSQDGRYSEVSCPIASGFSNQTLTFSYKINDLSFNFPFTAGFSNLLVESCSISTGDIINSQNQNTQDIINNNNTNSQNIINNNNSTTNQIIQDNQQNTQDIIDNQNQNTQQEIESQKVCKKYDKTSIKESDKYLNATGEYRESYSYGITDYINLTSVSIKELVHLDRTSQSSMCFYNINKTLISCIRNVSITNPITIPNDSSYVRFSINTTDDKPQFEVCSNGNQALNDSVNDLNDTLNNESSPDTEGYLEDFSENVASDTPITDLITMPLTLINAYINGMNSSCTSYNFGSLLGTELVMPCINLQQRLGSNIWSIIDVLFSIFMIFNISKLFISAFNNFTSLKDDFNNMYTNDYQPKHGGDE